MYAVAGVASATPADISPSYLTEGHNYAGNWFKNLWKSARNKGLYHFQPFVIIA
ncbi:conjugal transfer protein [Clostridioides difficile]|nr:conjugal transfer protein [Clostridioides difficile]